MHTTQNAEQRQNGGFMSRKVVLAGGCRTAIGVMGGALSTVPAADLGTIVIKRGYEQSRNHSGYG